MGIKRGSDREKVGAFFSPLLPSKDDFNTLLSPSALLLLGMEMGSEEEEEL